jgi:hypothetical protein
MPTSTSTVCVQLTSPLDDIDFSLSALSPFFDS